jgi:hypothetical protein
MKRYLLTIALLTITAGTTLGQPVEDRRTHLMRPRPESAKLQNIRVLDRAYLDVLHLLEQPGPCGEFFGGEADVVVDSLILQLKEQRISDTHIGVRMSGRFTLHQVEAIHTLPGREIQPKSKLVFNRYGDQYFLSEVWIAGRSEGASS